MDKNEWISKYTQMHGINENLLNATIPISATTTSSSDWSNIAFPMVRRVAASTLAGGYSYESDERIKRRKRIQKLERILDEKEFNEIVSKSEYDDIMVEKKDVKVGGLDFKYGETEEEKSEKKRKEREKKFERILKFLKKKNRK